MKKIKIAFSALIISASLLSTTSCSEEDLNTVPTESVGSSTIYSTADNLMTSINGMIRNMYVRQNSSQGQNGYTAQLIVADVMGDDLVFPATGTNWFISELRWNSTQNASSSTVAYPWDFWGSMIRNANNIITYGANASGDQSLKEKAIGEAYAFRAFGNFQLVQLYGHRYVKGAANDKLGIVLRTDPSDIGAKERATVAEVYAQIWADLEQAETLLTGKRKTNNSHFGVDNVLGLKARVALVQQDYSKAAEYAALARQGKSLMTQAQYKEGFNDYKNPEWMWGITIQGDQSDYFGNFFAYMSRNFNSGQIRSAPKVMNSALYAAFPTSDVRTQLVSPTGEHPNLELPSSYLRFDYTSEKFVTKNKDNSVALGDVPFMRVAEMYLIEAEAKFNLGDEVGSKAVLAELVTARDAEFTGFTTSGSDYLNEILLNRRIELWGEGFRFLDLKRLNQKLDRSAVPNLVESVATPTIQVAAGDSKWQWKIPQAEINSNPLCQQN